MVACTTAPTPARLMPMPAQGPGRRAPCCRERMPASTLVAVLLSCFHLSYLPAWGASASAPGLPHVTLRGAPPCPALLTKRHGGHHHARPPRRKVRLHSGALLHAVPAAGMRPLPLGGCSQPSMWICCAIQLALPPAGGTRAEHAGRHHASSCHTPHHATSRHTPHRTTTRPCQPHPPDGPCRRGRRAR